MSAAEVATTVEDTPASEEPYELTTADTAECTCPDFCERDHDLD